MEEQNFLDPLNDTILSSSFTDYKLELQKKVENYRKHPNKIKIIFFGACLAGIIWAAILLYLRLWDMYLIGIGFIPAVAYYLYVKEFENEVVLYLLCEKNNWAFNPRKDKDRAQRFISLFPNIFDTVGNEVISNQIWGSVGKDANGFWSATFMYARKKRVSKRNILILALIVFVLIFGITIKTNFFYYFLIAIILLRIYDFKKNFHRIIIKNTKGQDQEVEEKTAFVIQMNEVLPCSFSLFRSGGGDPIKTESEEFNKLYKIVKKSGSEQQIIQILSPSLQVRLIDFAKRFSLESISFQDNCMIIIFNDKVWKMKYTNFLKSIAIDERDVKRYDDMVGEMTALPKEMLQFLD